MKQSVELKKQLIEISERVKGHNVQYGVMPKRFMYSANPIYLIAHPYYVLEVKKHIFYHYNGVEGFFPIPKYEDTPIEDTIKLTQELSEKYQIPIFGEVFDDEFREALLSLPGCNVMKSGYIFPTIFYPSEFDFELKGKEYEGWRRHLNKGMKIIGDIELTRGSINDTNLLLEQQKLWRKEYHKIQGEKPVFRSNMGEFAKYMKKPECFLFTIKDKNGDTLYTEAIIFPCGVEKGYSVDVLVQNMPTSLGKLQGSTSKYLMYKNVKEMMDSIGATWHWHDGGTQPTTKKGEVDTLTEHKKSLRFKIVEGVVLKYRHRKRTLFDLV